MLFEKERLDLVDFGKKMSSVGLSKGTSGNLSIRDPQSGYMIITPSGIGYFDTQPDDCVVMSLNGEIIEGSRKPSSEHYLHAAIYRVKPEMNAIVHAHSTFSTTLACMRQPINAIHYYVGLSGTSEVKCADYATAGTQELAENAAKAIGSSKAVLLANHGLLACGINLSTAFSLAESLEGVAELQWRTMCAGGGIVLDKLQMDEMIEGMKTYGQPNPGGKN